MPSKPQKTRDERTGVKDDRPSRSVAPRERPEELYTRKEWEELETHRIFVEVQRRFESYVKYQILAIIVVTSFLGLIGWFKFDQYVGDAVRKRADDIAKEYSKKYDDTREELNRKSNDMQASLRWTEKVLEDSSSKSSEFAKDFRTKQAALAADMDAIQASVNGLRVQLDATGARAILVWYRNLLRFGAPEDRAAAFRILASEEYSPYLGETLPLLCSTMTHDADVRIRKEGVKTLTRMHIAGSLDAECRDQAFHALSELIRQEGEVDLKAEAISAISRFEEYHKMSVEIIVPFVDSPERRLQEASMTSLRRIGRAAHPAVPRLLGVVRGSANDLASTALITLKQIHSSDPELRAYVVENIRSDSTDLNRLVTIVHIARDFREEPNELIDSLRNLLSRLATNPEYPKDSGINQLISAEAILTLAVLAPNAAREYARQLEEIEASGGDSQARKAAKEAQVMIGVDIREKDETRPSAD